MRAWTELDLEAFRHNVRLLKRRLCGGARLLAVLKADAYGHGAEPLAREALRAGCRAIGVADCSEARALRQAGCDAPIVLLGALLRDEFDEAVALRAECAVCRPEDVRFLERSAARARTTARVHVEVDTGMSRWGVAPEDLPKVVRAIDASPHLSLAGLYTHIATVVRDDPDAVRRQVELFERVTRPFARASVVRHAAHTSATLRSPEAHFDMVRCGIGLVGIDPGFFRAARFPARPVLAFRARVAQIRDVAAGSTVGYDARFTAPRAMRVAIVAAGYADGVPYRWGAGGFVLLRGKRAPIVGSVMMDAFAVDASGVPGVRVGDVVTIFGSDGEGRIGVEEIAGRVGTIPYEITCRIGGRVRRIVRGGAARWAAAL